MGRISIKDDYMREMFGELKPRKLKGHVRLELHNCHTGKTIVEEGDNTVTYAIRDILANNLMSALNFGSLAPIWSNWYGGVLCYKQAHPLVNGQLDPADYFIRGNNIQELTAHAGPTAPSDFADDLKRGSPNTAVQVLTENSVRQGWEWGSSQGNGVIGALSLCHKDVGDCGTGAVSTAFASFQPFATIQSGVLTAVTIETKSKHNVYAMYDGNHSIYFHHGTDEDFHKGHIMFSSNKITVIIRRLPMFDVGLYETMDTSDTPTKTFTVELSFNLYYEPSFFYDKDTKYLWIFSNTQSDVRSYDNRHVDWAIIDCENETVVDEGWYDHTGDVNHGAITSDTADLAPLGIAVSNDQQRQGNKFRQFALVKHGNYVYLPTGTAWYQEFSQWSNCYQVVNGYKKINISNQSDQSAIEFVDTQTLTRPTLGGSGSLLVSSGRIMNGGVGYTCADQFGIDGSAIQTWSFSDVNSIVALATPMGMGYGSQSVARYLVADKLVNTTLFNLDSAQTKTATQSMTVTYTLTEQSAE